MLYWKTIVKFLEISVETMMCGNKFNVNIADDRLKFEKWPEMTQSLLGTLTPVSSF